MTPTKVHHPVWQHICAAVYLCLVSLQLKENNTSSLLGKVVLHTSLLPILVSHCHPAPL